MKPIAKAQAEQAAVAYKGTFLQSLREVADALNSIDKGRQQIAENEIRTNAAREYLRLTDMRYRGACRATSRCWTRSSSCSALNST